MSAFPRAEVEAVANRFEAANVRAEQERVAADPTLNVHLVDLDGLTHLAETTPGVHFDARSLDEIGSRLYSKFKQVRR